MSDFQAKAIYNSVASTQRANEHETLVYNADNGFSWLRGKRGAYRQWEGRFTTAIDAERACVEAGFEPTAIYYPIHIHSPSTYGQ